MTTQIIRSENFTKFDYFKCISSGMYQETEEKIYSFPDIDYRSIILATIYVDTEKIVQKYFHNNLLQDLTYIGIDSLQEKILSLPTAVLCEYNVLEKHDIIANLILQYKTKQVFENLHHLNIFYKSADENIISSGVSRPTFYGYKYSITEMLVMFTSSQKVFASHLELILKDEDNPITPSQCSKLLHLAIYKSSIIGAKIILNHCASVKITASMMIDSFRSCELFGSIIPYESCTSKLLLKLISSRKFMLFLSGLGKIDKLIYCLKLIIDKIGSDINLPVNNGSSTMMMLVCSIDSYKLLFDLLIESPYIDLSVSIGNKCAITLARLKGNTEYVDKILVKSPELRERLSTIDLLIEENFYPNCNVGDVHEVVRVLKVIDINLCIKNTKTGLTPLMASLKHPEVVAELIKYDTHCVDKKYDESCINMVNNSGLTAIEILMSSKPTRKYVAVLEELLLSKNIQFDYGKLLTLLEVNKGKTNVSTLSKIKTLLRIKHASMV